MRRWIKGANAGDFSNPFLVDFGLVQEPCRRADEHLQHREGDRPEDLDHVADYDPDRDLDRERGRPPGLNGDLDHVPDYDRGHGHDCEGSAHDGSWFFQERV